MVRADRETFAMAGRTRRPPLDPTNALLSFLYALLLSDCVAGAQGVGLDPQMGFLHGLRPGRPSLGLDLMEEFRPVLADRLTLTLINRRQISDSDFDRRPGGAVLLNDTGRKKVVVAYQERKQEEVFHPGGAAKNAPGTGAPCPGPAAGPAPAGRIWRPIRLISTSREMFYDDRPGYLRCVYGRRLRAAAACAGWRSSAKTSASGCRKASLNVKSMKCSLSA